MLIISLNISSYQSKSFLREPKKLLSWLYQVNGDEGLHVTESFGGAVITKEIIFVVDPGSGIYHDRLISNIKAINRKNKKIIILGTHLHHDHMAAAKKLQEKDISYETWSPKPIITVKPTGDVYASDLYGEQFPNIKIDRFLTKEKILFNGGYLEVIPTPGHAPDHACFIFDIDETRVAFIADIFGGHSERIGSDMAKLYKSVKRMLSITPEPDYFIEGHGDGTLRPWSEFKILATRLTIPTKVSFGYLLDPLIR